MLKAHFIKFNTKVPWILLGAFFLLHLKLSAQAEPPPQPTVTFVAYNLKNYLKMWRSQEGENALRDKPENEIEQVIGLLKKTQSDIIGVSEIGTMDDLEDLQRRLQQQQLRFPYLHLAKGSDPTRRLGILSRFKITPHTPPAIDFKMDGNNYQIRRGILDVTVHTPIGEIRFIGLHLKSKRPSPDFAQDIFRYNEAFTVKKHLTKIHTDAESKNSKVIVFGDFNDTTQSTTLKTIIGSSKTPSYCRAINLRDKHGLNWTYHWDYQDVYSRFDFVLTNRALLSHIDQKSSYIMDTSDYPKASDHRPLVVKFK